MTYHRRAGLAPDGIGRAEIYVLDIRRYERSQDEKAIQKRIDDWGSQIHFLYCSTWACMIGCLLVYHFNPKVTYGEWMWELPALFLFVSLFHHLRYLRFDEVLERRALVNEPITHPKHDKLIWKWWMRVGLVMIFVLQAVCMYAVAPPCLVILLAMILVFVFALLLSDAPSTEKPAM